jgi:hypothetical protein
MGRDFLLRGLPCRCAFSRVTPSGVGLKQSCAALSDLSSVLVRNGAERHCQLGVIAKSLQKRDGV